MKRAVYLTSTKSGAGKSIVAIGMYLKLQEQHVKLGYFKPIGDAMTRLEKTRTDKDVSVISAVVARKFSKEEICPVFLNPEYYLDEITIQEAGETFLKIQDAFTNIQSKTDFIIIEGNHSVSQYAPLGLDDVKFAKAFNAEMIICAPISDDDDLNPVIATYEYLQANKLPILGVVLNSRTKTAEARIERYHIPLLQKRQIPVLGFLKNSRDLEKPTVSEVMDATGAQLISGDFIKVKNNLIGAFVVGAMLADSALKIFRSSVDKCVITGGDRTDIALAALDTGTNLIVFTGGFKPVQRVISVAEQKGIPLLLTSADTYTVTEQIRRIKTHIQPNEIEICRAMLDDLNWRLIQKMVI